MSAERGDEVDVATGAPKPPRGRPARYTKDGLLDLVVRVFNERGYEAASMEDLAKASGFTKSTFYHHVSGKEELLRLAVDRALGALSAALDDTIIAGGRPVEQLETAIRRTTEVLLAELPYVTLLLRVRGNTDVEKDALARRRAIDTRLADLVTAAAGADEIRGDIDPRLVTRLLFGMVNSITEWYRPGGRTNTRNSIVEATVSLAMQGLAINGAGPRPGPAWLAPTMRQFAPAFPVSDLAASLAHYARLGFSTSEYTGDSAAGGYGFARRDTVELHLGTAPPGRATSPTTAYLFVDDADALAAEWRAAGADVRSPEETPWGKREWVMIDPDGNTVRFGSPLDNGDRR